MSLELNDDELLRYSRQILLPQIDVAGQLKLKASRALIVGLGGLGSPVALYLAAAGVGELHLADFDTVDLTNLQRQVLHDSRQIGVSKVDSAIARLTAINPQIRLLPHRAALDEDSLAAAVAAVSLVDEVAGRYRTVQVGGHTARVLLAKNPAGWQEALSMIDQDADGLVIAVNGQVPDGEDLSWLWDVRFEAFETMKVVAAGERAADLSVRLLYAGAQHITIDDPMKAIASCPPGRVEVLANYTAFRDLGVALERAEGGRK